MNITEKLLISLQNVYPFFNGRVPTLMIPPFGQRGENKNREGFFNNLYQEAQKFGLLISEDDVIFSIVTPAASPHTTEIITIEENGEQLQIPIHLIVWWGNLKKRIDFLSLSRMEKEEREKYLFLIGKNINFALQFLHTKLPEEYRDNPAQVLEIYGLVGHTTDEERKNTGLSRGAQSNPEGHINICFHPYDKYRRQVEQQGINAADFLKHTGVMDTILMTSFGDFFSQITGFLLKIPNLSTSWELKHAFSQDQISIYEGLRLNFYEKPIGLGKSLEIVSSVIGFYDQFYQLLKEGFDSYWRNIGNDGEKNKIISQIKQSLIERLKQIGIDNLELLNQLINNLVDFALFFKPTYQQLKNWEKDRSINENSKKIISQLKSKYEQRRKRLKSMTSEEKKVFIEKVAGFYGVSSIVAESLVLMIENQIADPADDWKNIKFTFPNQISLSWMIEDYEIDDNGEILVKKITIAPRFMTEKGAFEDIGGMRVVRTEGK